MTNKILWNDLIPTQNCVRDICKVLKFMKRLRETGTFTRPVEISYLFDINQYYIHDGHHRCVALFLSGVDGINPRQYRVTNRLSNDYNVVNFPVGYVTPFDIQDNVRISNLSDWKNIVHNFRNIYTDRETVDFILKNKRFYTRTRKVNDVIDLVFMFITQLSYNKGINIHEHTRNVLASVR